MSAGREVSAVAGLGALAAGLLALQALRIQEGALARVRAVVALVRLAVAA
jgi:hypothetical protein